LAKEGVRRFRRYGRRLQRLFAERRMDWDEIKPRLAAWNAHAATADGIAMRRRVLGEMVFQRTGSG